jgi:hypothetical protein
MTLHTAEASSVDAAVVRPSCCASPLFARSRRIFWREFLAFMPPFHNSNSLF